MNQLILQDIKNSYTSYLQKVWRCKNTYVYPGWDYLKCPQVHFENPYIGAFTNKNIEK